MKLILRNWYAGENKYSCLSYYFMRKFLHFNRSRHNVIVSYYFPNILWYFAAWNLIFPRSVYLSFLSKCYPDNWYLRFVYILNSMNVLFQPDILTWYLESLELYVILIFWFPENVLILWYFEPLFLLKIFKMFTLWI